MLSASSAPSRDCGMSAAKSMLSPISPFHCLACLATPCPATPRPARLSRAAQTSCASMPCTVTTTHPPICRDLHTRRSSIWLSSDHTPACVIASSTAFGMLSRSRRRLSGMRASITTRSGPASGERCPIAAHTSRDLDHHIPGLDVAPDHRADRLDLCGQLLGQLVRELVDPLEQLRGGLVEMEHVAPPVRLALDVRILDVPGVGLQRLCGHVILQGV